MPAENVLAESKKALIMFKKILVLLLIAGAMYAMAGESTLGARTAIVERNALIQSI